MSGKLPKIKGMSELEQELMRTLSFYQPMSKEQIYLELDDQFLSKHKNLNSDDLDISLKRLTKRKIIRKIKEKEQTKWIRNYKQKLTFQRLLISIKKIFKSSI